MLTDEDIKKITEAHKEVFPTKDDFDDLRKHFSKLQTSVVSFATGTQKNGEEIAVLNYRVKRAENVLDKAALKLGLKYEH